MSTRHHPSPSKPRPARRDALVTAPRPPIVERPDGYYWIGDGDLGEFGPFETYELARTDRDTGIEAVPAPADVLQEVRRGTGVADWADEETGESAAGTSPPHLQEE